MVPKLTVWTVNHALSFQRWFTFFTYVRTIWRIIFFVCIVINFFLLKMFFRFTRCSLFYIIAAFVRFYFVFPGVFFVLFFNFLKILLGLDTLNFLDGFNSGSSTIGWFISFKHTYFFFHMAFISVSLLFFWWFTALIPLIFNVGIINVFVIRVRRLLFFRCCIFFALYLFVLFDN